jgi:hypothetical protein
MVAPNYPNSYLNLGVVYAELSPAEVATVENSFSQSKRLVERE